MIFIGIDPGLSGAMVVLSDNSQLIAAHDLPSIKNGSKREFQTAEVGKLLRSYVDKHGAQNVFCMLEKHTPRPGQGIGSQCKAAGIVGELKGLLVGLGISYELTHPATWSKVMRDKVGTDKKAQSVLTAGRRWPDLDLSRKKDHNRADAALIAE